MFGHGEQSGSHETLRDGDGGGWPPEEYVRALAAHAPDLVWVLDGDGVCRYASPSSRRVLGYTPAELRGRSAGEIVHPEDRAALEGACRSWGEEEATAGRLSRLELRARHADGSWRMLELIGDDQMAHPVVQGTIVHGRDVTERVERERALLQQARHDVLTGLPTHLVLHDRLDRALAACRREGTQLAVLALDVDRLHEVNETQSHDIGDALLQALSARLRACLRESDTVARLGGDEFAVLLRTVANEEGAATAARKIIVALEQPVIVEARVLDVSVSIGIAVYPDHGTDSTALLQHAEAAMYAAKPAQKGYVVYAREQDVPGPSRLALRAELQAAITGDQLYLHYQPKVELRSGQVYGVEALVRWQHPRRGFIPPSEFLSLAEQSGLMRGVSMWGLEAAVRQARLWHDAGRSLNVAVNLSARDLQDPHLPGQIGELLARHGVAGSGLTVEIRETMLLADPRQARAVLTALSIQGVRLAVDDFGIGASALLSLRQLPVHELKIDASIVRDMVEAGQSNDPVIVRALIGLGHTLGLTVVAEGVEADATADLLLSLGCDMAQGYYLTRPLPPSDLAGWLDKRGAAPTPPAS